MKKQIISMSAIALAVLASSCAKNEVNDDSFGGNSLNPNQIAFRSSTGISRANDLAIGDLQDGTGFHVVGLLTDGAYIPGFADPAAENVLYAFDKTATPNAFAWKDATEAAKKLWPADPAQYPLTFFAAYPANLAITKDATSDATIAVPTNMPVTATAYQFNTMWEKNPFVLDGTKVSVDYLAALANVASKPVSGFADMSFKHIMSNLAFDIVVPTGYTAYVQSIKVANVASTGRSYDYKTQLWAAETAYADGQLAHFAHFEDATGAAQEITPAAPSVKGLTDGAAGFNTLKLMPQTAVTAWDAKATFATDATAWKAALDAATDDADKKVVYANWYMETTANKGMKDSEGWKGARIELTYILVDNNGKSVVGHKGATTAEDLYVRVGFPLDLNTLKFTKKVEGVDKEFTGLMAGVKYKFQIPLGTANATGGTLLDPTYVKSDGTTDPEKPVDNPKTDPGTDVAKGGIINFNVAISDWDEQGTIIGTVPVVPVP